MMAKPRKSRRDRARERERERVLDRYEALVALLGAIYLRQKEPAVS